MRYVPIVERYARLRSCYLQPLPPRRSRWRANLALWFAGATQCLSYDGTGWIGHVYREDQVPAVLAEYRNWLGENRIGR